MRSVRMALFLIVCTTVASSVELTAQTKTKPTETPKEKTAPPKAVDRKKLLSQPVPGYTLKKIEGFDVLIHDDVMKNNEDTKWKRKPLDVLELELGTIIRVLPKKVEEALHSVVIWAEWDDTNDPDSGKAVAKYYGYSGGLAIWNLSTNKHPGKANNVEIISMRSLTAEHQPDVKSERCVILHEFAHAIHFHIVGDKSPAVKTTFNAAMDRGLYDSSKDVNGRTIKPYASTNDHEYFAELTCCYLDKLHYAPFNRTELKTHDPNGYKLMEAVWGKADKLDAMLKQESAKAADSRVQKARLLLQEKKKDDAIKMLEKVVDLFPKTTGATEAKKLLEKLKS